MVVVFVDNLAPLSVETGIEERKFFEHRQQKPYQERHIGKTNSPFLCHWQQSLAQGYQRSAINLIKSRGVGNGTPGTLHMLSNTLAQTRQWLTIFLRLIIPRMRALVYTLLLFDRWYATGR